MQIIILDKKTPIEILNSICVRIRNILADLELCYPNFSLWIEKVFCELKSSDKRRIILAIDGDFFHILGVAIIKNTSQEKKICTLRVLREYQGQGIGTVLLESAIKALQDPRPLITVSELQIDIFKPFLEKYGFLLKDKVKSLYRVGKYEYFFNKKYEHTTVLLSIRPIYADAIFLGKKTVEFRKKVFSPSVNRVFVYSSSPIKKIVGYFDINHIEGSSPEVLWSKYQHVGHISREEYFEYYKGHSLAYGIVIKDYHKFNTPIYPNDIFTDFKAPQSYFYIDNVTVREELENEYHR